LKSDIFLQYLAEKRYLVSDGATGTNLIIRGLEQGKTCEDWVLENPKKITQLHKDFISSGADIILTSTFGASIIRLKQSGLDAKFEEINTTAVKIAKMAIENSDVLVAGSIGPLGQMMKPFGLMEATTAEKYYADQAELLFQAGVDMIVIETQFDIDEAKAAIRGAKSVGDIAVICSFSFDRGTKTMMGIGPTKFASEVKDLEITAIGINCGKSLDDNLNALKELAAATDLPIWFKPNAGLPQLDANGIPVYSVSPEKMAECVPGWIDNGAKIIGGCCGTSPDHLMAISKAINTHR